MSFEQLQGAIYGYAVDPRIDLASFAEKLAGIKMLISCFDNTQNRAALAGHALSARHKLRLQSAGLFGLWKGHIRYPPLGCN